MNNSLTQELTSQLAQLKKHQPTLFQKIQKQLKIFSTDPRHPSLRLHKLTDKLKNTWSISIDRNHRLIYYVTKNGAVFFAFGTHDQVYHK